MSYYHVIYGTGVSSQGSWSCYEKNFENEHKRKLEDILLEFERKTCGLPL